MLRLLGRLLTPAQYSRTTAAGIIAPGGRWIARCAGSHDDRCAAKDPRSGIRTSF